MDTVESPLPAKRSWVALGLLIVALVVFWPLVQHPTDLLVGRQNAGRNDLTAVFLGMRMFPRDVISGGQWPLWNPWILLGQPWIGNPQSASLYPPNWLAVAVGHPAALSWLMVLHQLWAGLGTYLFARRLGCRPWPAVLGGAVTVGAPFYVAQIGEGHINQVCLAAWIPWAFWAFEKWRQGEPSARWQLPVIFSLAVFCGHVQEAFYVVLALSLIVLAEMIIAVVSARKQDSLRQGFGWISVGLATVGLTAVEVAPIYVQTQQSIRQRSFSVEEAGQISAGWDHAWQLFDPLALGGPDAYHGSGMFFWETLCHFGLVPMLLAAWAVAAGWRRPGVARWALLAAFTVLFAVGPRTPVYTFFHAVMPGVALFRVPSRMFFFTSVLIAVLAAIGADELQSTLHKARAVLCWSILGVVSCAAAVLSNAMGMVPADALPWQRALCQPVIWGWLAWGCMAALLMTASRSRWICVGNGLAIVLVTAQLSGVAHALLRTIPMEHLRRNSMLATLVDEPGYDRVLVRHEHLTDDEAALHHICKLQGYEPAPLVRTADVFDALTTGKDTPDQMLGFYPVEPERWSKPLLDLLGVRWMVTEKDHGELPGWTKVADGNVPTPVAIRGTEPVANPFVLYRNEAAFPRAFVVGEAQSLGRQETLKRRLAGWDPRQSVLLEADVLPAGPRATFQAAEIIEYGTDRVVLEVEITAPGYLVLTDAWFPGWSAKDEQGHEIDVLRANHGLRAVPLTAGKHRVTMTFKPPLWTLSALVSLVSALWLGFTALNRGSATAASTNSRSIRETASV